MPGGYGTYGPWGSSGETYSQPEPSWQQQGGPGHPGGYNPNLNPPPQVTTPIIPVHEIIDAPIDYNLEDEKTDYLGGQLVLGTNGQPGMSNEEIAQTTGQTYNPNTGKIESSYNVPEHDEMSISQDSYNLYGDDLSKWPEAAKLRAKKSGFFGAQAEGMLGGVTGYEQEVNALKKKIIEGGGGYNEALASLTALHGGNEELAKMSALGIQEYLNRKTKGNPKALDDILTGQTQIEGLENFNFDKFIKQTGGLEPATDEYGKYLKGDALGYDPSGVHTWEDVESDPWLSEAYYGLTTGDPTQIPDWQYDKYLKEILYYGNPPGEVDSWDSWADSWYGGHYQGEGGGYDDSMSDLARNYWFSESLDDVTARKEERRKEGLGAAGMRASEMEQMYDREFSAKANPFFDPGYSQSVTEEMNPIAAGMELFDIARME